MCLWTSENSMGYLNKKIEFKLESIPTTILTCFALHTFCERIKKGVDEDLFQSQQVFQRNIQNSQENLPDKIYSGNTTEGIHVRNLLKEYISQNLLEIVVRKFRHLVAL